MKPVVYITGITRGIGRATAIKLVGAGAKVAGCYRCSDDDAAHLRSHLGSSALIHRADVTSSADVESAIAEAMALWGRIDVLVNNAGILRFGYLTFTSEQIYGEVVGTNLAAAMEFVSRVAATMKETGGGRIINLLSAVAQRNLLRAPCAIYSATKSALAGITRSLARELAPYKIAVNGVAPGFIDTDMLAAIPQNRLQEILSAVPLERYGTADEIAEVITYLAMKAPLYLTGAIIPVDGGYTA